MSYRDVNIKYILAGIIFGYMKFFVHDKKYIIWFLQFIGIMFGFYFSTKEFGTILNKNINSNIFIDLPISRTKPPDKKYSFDDSILILTNNKLYST